MEFRIFCDRFVWRRRERGKETRKANLDGINGLLPLERKVDWIATLNGEKDQLLDNCFGQDWFNAAEQVLSWQLRCSKTEAGR